ncbi:hypothetical protein SAMN05519103_00312 [Rhizobiales bacterium GAS113]|nr:hypothetical protein SAMN05519103_00312 [Rhizobiales bacterium GAS113]
MTFSHANQRAYHRLHSELEMHPYVSLEEDALASQIARLLRVNPRFDARRVLATAARYDREYRRAFPNPEIRTDTPLSDHAGSAGPVSAPTAGPASDLKGVAA